MIEWLIKDTSRQVIVEIIVNVRIRNKEVNIQGWEILLCKIKLIMHSLKQNKPAKVEYQKDDSKLIY